MLNSCLAAFNWFPLLLLPAGVYCPAAKGHTSTELCLERLTLDIAEKTEDPGRRYIHHHAVVVYVNMCDVLNGRATPDIYV